MRRSTALVALLLAGAFLTEGSELGDVPRLLEVWCSG